MALTRLVLHAANRGATSSFFFFTCSGNPDSANPFSNESIALTLSNHWAVSVSVGTSKDRSGEDSKRDAFVPR